MKLVQRQPEISNITPFFCTLALSIPLFRDSVQAGFPSPAEDFTEGTLDLNDLLVQRPSSTFMVRVAGLSMIKAGIEPNDILVVDKSEDVSHGDIVIAVVDGELTVKRFSNIKGHISLISENKSFPPIEFKDGSELIIWGVVSACIKQFKHVRPS